ncbi:MAG TPA: D-alanine--D-alanine ligase [bacterium]
MSAHGSVAVLMGGPSGEHGISLKSGRGVALALAELGWDVETLELPRHGTAADAADAVRRHMTQRRPDVTFIALHGPFGEDGTIQEVCEELHIAYTGSEVAASRLGMDKIASRAAFTAAGLAVPRCRVLAPGAAETAGWPREGELPAVVKPSNQGSSLGVSLVERPEEWARAVEAAAAFGAPVLIEEYVRGRELTVGVVGERVLPVVGVVPRHAFFDFDAKYTAGETRYEVPAALDEASARRVQDAGWLAHRAIGARHFSRTDLILREDGTPVVLEVNTIPGFTPTSLLPKAAACVGLSYGALCETLVQLAWLPAAAAAAGEGGR